MGRGGDWDLIDHFGEMVYRKEGAGHVVFILFLLSFAGDESALPTIL
jgi:hypothetical protein